MARKISGADGIGEKLHQAIDSLRKDVTRVEVWATALSVFAKPVPGYRPNPKYELGKPVESGKPAEDDDQPTPENESKKVPE